MKKLLVKLIFYSLLLGFYTGYSQSTEAINARVLEIKKWYGEIQSIGLKNCITKEKVVEEEISDEIEKFTQTLKKCNLNETYQVVQGSFNSYEWSSNINLYRKNGKIFFVYIETFSIGGTGEFRFYFNDRELLIKQVEKIEDVIEDKITKKENKENLFKNTTQVFENFMGANEVIDFKFEE